MVNEKDIGELITFLRIDIAVLSEKVDGFNRVEGKVDGLALTLARVSQEIASEKSRLDRVIDDHAKAMDNLRQGQKWAVGIGITCVSLFITALGLFWSVMKGVL